MTDKETLEVYDARAEEYATSFCLDMEPDTQLQSFLEALAAGADVLDLGCGPGRSAAIMAGAGHRVLATDASAEMVRLAATRDGVTAQQATFDELGGEAVYDGIWANFSLLHADPDKLPGYVGTIAGMLRSEGIFHIGMKLGNGQHRDGIGRLYTYVTEDGLDQMLQDVGLRRFAIWKGQEKGLAGTLDPYVIMQARKDA